MKNVSLWWVNYYYYCDFFGVGFGVNGCGFVKTFTVDPGKYRQVDEIVQSATRNKGSLEVLDVCVTEDEEEEKE